MTVEELIAKMAAAMEAPPSELAGEGAELDSMGSLAAISVLDEITGGAEIPPEEAETFTTVAAVIGYARRKGIVSD